MKVYVVFCPSLGMYFRGGERGWGKKPRIYHGTGPLNQSIRNNFRQFPEFRDMGVAQFIFASHAAGNEIALLVQHGYQVKEFVIE